MPRKSSSLATSKSVPLGDAIEEPMKRIAALIPEGNVYAVVVRPDGKQEFFQSAEEARAAARASGGRVLVRPTRAGLRVVSAAIGASAVDQGETTTTVQPLANGVTLATISNKYLSLTLILRDGAIQSAIAAVTLGIGDRSIPAIGAAMAEEREGRAATPQHHIVMKAATRAVNRGLEDLTGAINILVEKVQRQQAPYVILMSKVKELGLTVQAANEQLKKELGVAMTEVGYDQIDQAVGILEHFAQEGGRASPDGNQQSH
jgi:hypothetical protein